jgi:hypothetical protein
MGKDSTILRDGRSGRFIVGRENMSRLNAMEGIRQRASSRAMFAEFDRMKLSPEERRKAIAARHGKKG